MGRSVWGGHGSPSVHSGDLPAMAALTLMALFFGGTFVAAKWALTDLSAIAVAALRFVLASAVLLTCTRILGHKLGTLGAE